jgi:hypothetical protein
VDGPLEKYDFLKESFDKSDEEVLLKNMAHHSDIGELASHINRIWQAFTLSA